MSIFWAVNFSIAKMALEEVEPLAFNALRFPLAAATLLVLLKSRGRVPLPRREDALRIVGLAVLGNVLYQLLFIFGLDRTRAGVASLLLAGTPIVTALLSAAVGHERVTARVWAGVLTTFAGIALVAAPGGDPGASGSVGGAIILVGASLSWAAYTVSAQPLVERYGSMSVTAWTLWVGSALLVLIGAPAMARMDFDAVSAGAWLGIAYSGTFSIGLAYVLWYNGVRHVGNTRTATYSNLVPAIALAVAWWWLGETPTLREVIGAGVIIGGVTLARFPRAAWRPRQ